MQILEPPQTKSYSTEDGHFIKTFLISTKPNDANWQISKETGHDKVKSFIGKPFVIIPEHLSSTIQKGHVFADTKEALLEEYKKHTHGIIESISSPFFYGDGTDDYFYTANIKLNDSKAASALIEHGNTWNTFSVSPHIWGDPLSDWEGISLSLVPQGAYGKDAVVSKYCKGERKVCTNSLAASDSLAAATISSLLAQNENKGIMSSTTVQVPQVTQVPTEPVKQQEQPKQDNSKLEELESLKKQLAEEQLARKEKEETVTKLLNKDKTNTLNKIFGEVKDESIRKTLIDKYLPQDTDILNDFYQDVNTHVLPSLVEAAKSQAEAELKQKTVEENKGKSKAASTLPKEPQVTESKAASIVPKSVNEIIKFDKLMRGEF